MTTNEAIELARNSFRKLGYKPEDFQVDGPPTMLEGPINSKNLGHIPFCQIEWNSPKPRSQEEFDRSYNIQFDIDMQRKQVVGMSLSSKRFFRPPPKIDVEPELESDYRKRMRAAGQTNFVSPYADYLSPYPPQTNLPPDSGPKLESPGFKGDRPKMFIRTNAPPRFSPQKPDQIAPKPPE